MSRPGDKIHIPSKATVDMLRPRAAKKAVKNKPAAMKRKSLIESMLKGINKGP